MFESESLRWPGFIEFDDVNSKVLTYSAQVRAYNRHLSLTVFLEEMHVKCILFLVAVAQ